MREMDGVIPEEIRKLFTDGLKAGYTGKTEIKVVHRGGNSFGLNSSHFESPDRSLVYHDEWIGGGGQEIVDTFPGREQWTRTYSGRSAKPEVLSALKITENDVTTYLKEKIQELGEATRLDKDCLPDPDGNWRYIYLATSYPDIPAVGGIEKIEFKDQLVFVHIFGISKI